jgi:hypothetical protein
VVRRGRAPAALRAETDATSRSLLPNPSASRDRLRRCAEGEGSVVVRRRHETAALRAETDATSRSLLPNPSASRDRLRR